MRKPWMDSLQSYRFAECGRMTQATKEAWRNAKDVLPPNEFAYAAALGISVEEARERIAAQQARVESRESSA